MSLKYGLEWKWEQIFTDRTPENIVSQSVSQIGRIGARKQNCVEKRKENNPVVLWKGQSPLMKRLWRQLSPLCVPWVGCTPTSCLNREITWKSHCDIWLSFSFPFYSQTVWFTGVLLESGELWKVNSSTGLRYQNVTFPPLWLSREGLRVCLLCSNYYFMFYPIIHTGQFPYGCSSASLTLVAQ